MYASKEELYFSWFLDELLEAGYIDSYKFEPEPFYLCDKVSHAWMEQLKTKERLTETTLLQGHIYTPDFNVFWNKKAHKIFYTDFSDNYNHKHYPFYAKKGSCYIEIKPVFDQNNMTRLFRINQKWVYAEYGEYVNLIKVPDIFEKTFTPERYLKTDKSMKPRKIKFKTRSLKEYNEITRPD